MKIKVAVVGLGHMGRKHITAIRAFDDPDIDVVAVSDISQRTVDEVTRDYAIQTGDVDWKRVVTDSRVDMVHVCTPNSSHFEISELALAHHKHVISEKPLALTAEEAGELCRLVTEHRVTGAVNYTYRGHEAVQVGRRLVQGGELGTVRLIRGGYLQDWLASPYTWDWRVDAALSGPSRAVADVGTHWVDLAAYVSGRQIRRLTSDIHVVMPVRYRSGRDAPTDSPLSVQVSTEDYASVLFHTDDARGQFTVSQVSPGHRNSLWLEVDGSAGSMRWSSEQPHVLELRRKGEKVRLTLDALPDGPPNPLGERSDEGALRRILGSAYAAAADVDPPPAGAFLHADFADGWYAAAVVDSVLESARTSGWVDITPSTRAEGPAVKES